MTAAGAGAEARVPPANWLAVAGVAAAMVVVLWFFGSGERELRRSAAGFGGLVEWLQEGGLDAREFSGGGYLVEGKVGLRILPLHDTDLTAARVSPETPEELVLQTAEGDIGQEVVHEKIALLPSLVILPKWRSGVRVLGVAHRDLLIPSGELDRLLGQLPVSGATIRRDPGGYGETAVPGGAAGLFHAQTVAGARGCEPVLGRAEAMILARCPLPGSGNGHSRRPDHFWLLSDPDLMNNHGLAFGGNAALALEVVAAAAGGGPVVLDLTDHVATITAEDEAGHERSWQDIARLFGWPFGAVWIAFGALAALVLWRALVRYGPVEGGDDDGPHRASREVSIDAKARLLRLADHDTELLRMHVAARLHGLAAELFGPHRPAGAEPLALVSALLARRAPGLARELGEVCRLPQGRPDAQALLARLDRFEDCIVRIRDELGRASGARG